MESITLFYATTNKSKLHNMRYRLRNYPVQILCPDDLNLHLDVEESGHTAVENALIKATAYHQAVRLPTIAGDSGLYIDGLPSELQPGLCVRRVNGRVLTDDEMIDHYAALAQNAGGDCYLRYFTGIALITENNTLTKVLKEPLFKLSPIPNINRNHRGNPLDVLSITADGRFYNEYSDAERTALDQEGERDFTNFLISHLLPDMFYWEKRL